MKVLAAAIVALAFAAPAAAQPKLTPAERAAITRSIDAFVNHAVKRSDPAGHQWLLPAFCAERRVAFRLRRWGRRRGRAQPPAAGPPRRRAAPASSQRSVASSPYGARARLGDRRKTAVQVLLPDPGRV